MSSEAEEKDTKQSEWTPEKVDRTLKVIDAVGDKFLALGDKYISYKREASNAENKYLEVATGHNRQLILILAAFLASLVGLMSILAYVKIASGDALMFVVGTMTGFILLFIQRLVARNEPREDITVPDE